MGAGRDTLRLAHRAVPPGRSIDARRPGIGAAGAMAVLARSGCTTVGDHHYIFPRGSGDIVGAIVGRRGARPAAARRRGARWTSGHRRAACRRTSRWRPPTPRSRHRRTPSSATTTPRSTRWCASPSRRAPRSPSPRELLRESAALARRSACACTPTRPRRSRRRRTAASALARRPTDYLESLGWLGPDVWMAHGVHLDEPAIARFAETGTGVAHCPSSNARLAAGIAPVRALLAPACPLASGSTARHRTSRASSAPRFARPCSLNRLRTGADAMTVRDGAARRDDGRGTGARARGGDSARSRSESSRTSSCGASTASSTRASWTRSRPWASAPCPGRTALRRRQHGGRGRAARDRGGAGARPGGRRRVARAGGAALSHGHQHDRRSSAVPATREDARPASRERSTSRGGTWLYSEPQPGVTGSRRRHGVGLASLTVVSPGGCASARPARSPSSCAMPPQPGWAAQPLFFSCANGAARLVQDVEHGHRRRQHLPVVLRRRHGLPRGGARRHGARSGPPDGDEYEAPVAALVTGNGTNAPCPRRRAPIHRPPGDTRCARARPTARSPSPSSADPAPS